MNKKELLKYLNTDFNISIRDPLWKDIFLTKDLYKLFKSSRLQQQNNVRQLGPTYLAYPGATHTRLNHSLGVYHISRKIIISLLKRALNENIDINLTRKGILSFLSAALLHDIGHFPYTHSLKDIVTYSHEKIAVDIIKKDKEINSILKKDLGLNINFVCNIIDDSNDKYNNSEISFYKHLLSGTIDPDKIDYLCRDAFYCGVPYGIQDANYIFDHLTYFDDKICILETAASSIQNIIFSKYMMYQNVCWLNTVRSATAMVKNSIYLGLKENIIKEKDLFNLRDLDLINLANSKKDFEPFSLVLNVEKSKVYKSLYSIDFDKANSIFKDCVSLDKRYNLALKIFKTLKNEFGYNDLKYYQIIIDIPEPIHFESDMLILTENKNLITFSNWNKINFSQAKNQLRKIRIFGPDYINKDDLKKSIDKIC